MFVFLWAYEQNEMEDSSGICMEKMSSKYFNIRTRYCFDSLYHTRW